MQQRIEDLRAAVEDLTGEVARLRLSFSRRTWAVIALAGVLGAALILAVHTQAENDRRIDAANRRWCPLIGLLTVHPGEPRPTTARGAQIADRAGDLARDFHCA